MCTTKTYSRPRHHLLSFAQKSTNMNPKNMYTVHFRGVNAKYPWLGCAINYRGRQSPDGTIREPLCIDRPLRDYPLGCCGVVGVLQFAMYSSLLSGALQVNPPALETVAEEKSLF